MTEILIGKSGDQLIAIDLKTLLPTRLLIQANSGGGKSYLIRKIVEQAFGKVQMIIIDWAGEFSTLRERYDYVLVGEGGETPIAVRSAALLATKLLELKASAICDLYSLKPEDRHAWVKGFIESMMNAPKKLWHPVLVIIDEAHKFCPEKGEGESVAKQAVLSLASDGRKYGFCLVAATQRLSKLDKSCASELLNVLIGPTFIDLDLERAHKALGIIRADWHSFDEQMRTTEPGNFWALGRAISKKRILVKVDPVETSHPESGVGAIAPPPMPENIGKLLPSLADIPHEVERKAKTEADLRAEISALKRQLQERPKEIVSKPESIETPVFKEGELDRLEAIAIQFHKASSDLTKASNDIGSALATAKQIASKPVTAVTPAALRSEQPRNASLVPTRAAPQRPTNGQLPTSLPEGQAKILQAVIQFQEHGLTPEQISILVGYKRATRDKYLGQLIANELVIKLPGSRLVYPTQEGIEMMPNVEPLPTGDDLRYYWAQKLPAGEARIMDELYAAWPDFVKKEVLDEKCNMKRATRDKYIGFLRARYLIEEQPGMVRASAMLFG